MHVGPIRPSTSIHAGITPVNGCSRSFLCERKRVTVRSKSDGSDYSNTPRLVTPLVSVDGGFCNGGNWVRDHGGGIATLVGM